MWMTKVDCIDAELVMQLFLEMLDNEHECAVVQEVSLSRQSSKQDPSKVAHADSQEIQETNMVD